MCIANSWSSIVCLCPEGETPSKSAGSHKCEVDHVNPDDSNRCLPNGRCDVGDDGECLLNENGFVKCMYVLILL